MVYAVVTWAAVGVWKLMAVCQLVINVAINVYGTLSKHKHDDKADDERKKVKKRSIKLSKVPN